MPALRLMTYNLLEGGEGGGARRLDLIASVIRAARPDVLALCEAHGFAESPSRFADLCAAVGMRGRVAPSESGDHVALLARLPHAVVSFEPVAMGGAGAAGMGEVRIAGLGDLQVAACHLDHRDPESRRREAESLLRRLDPERSCVVLGDLNGLSHRDGLTRRDLMALPLHHVERHVDSDGEVATSTLRVMEEGGLVDAWRHVNPEAPTAEGWTVPTGMPRPPRLGPKRVDYVLVSDDLAAHLTGAFVHREPPAEQASDHFPVVADLVLGRRA